MRLEGTCDECESENKVLRPSPGHQRLLCWHCAVIELLRAIFAQGER